MKKQRLFLTCPAFSLNGGIRVILEWANNLSPYYEVLLRVQSNETACGWFLLDPNVRVVTNDAELEGCDLLVVASPHAHRYLSYAKPVRKFVFLQMMEHLFRPSDKRFERACEALYLTHHPLITISQWGIERLKNMGRTGPTHYIGNGVNTEHFPLSYDFPLSYEGKREETILVEGWVPTNATKDTAHLGPLVAQALKAQGFRIIAYGGVPLSGPHAHVPHEYYFQPDRQILNRLYERALILVKATHLDFRSCSPMEAMTKGTVTARAITQGDDDLIHEVNCLRSDYSLKGLLRNAQELVHNAPLRERLSWKCYDTVKLNTWNHWTREILQILDQP